MLLLLGEKSSKQIWHFYRLVADRQEYCFTTDFYGLAADR